MRDGGSRATLSQDVLFRRDGSDLVDDLLGKIGACPHRLILGAFHVHRCGAVAVDINPDAAGLAFPAAFLAFAPVAFTFSFALSFQLSFALALSKGVGAHTERNAERRYARGKS